MVAAFASSPKRIYDFTDNVLEPAWQFAISVGMIKIVRAPIATGIAVGTREQAPDAAGAFETAAQVSAPGVTDQGCVAAVPLLNDPVAVVDVARLRIELPLTAWGIWQRR